MLHSIWNTQGCPQQGEEVNIVTTTAQSKPHTFGDDIQAVHVKMIGLQSDVATTF